MYWLLLSSADSNNNAGLTIANVPLRALLYSLRKCTKLHHLSVNKLNIVLGADVSKLAARLL